MVALRNSAPGPAGPSPATPEVVPATAAADRDAPAGVGAGGPVGDMLADLDARLSGDDYARWLLPPEPRSPVESAVHALSLGAGVIAVTAGAVLMWSVL